MQNKKTELYGPLLEHPKLKKRGFVLLAVLTVRFKAADRRVISRFHTRDDIVVRQKEEAIYLVLGKGTAFHRYRRAS